jgi:hypothetical protein
VWDDLYLLRPDGMMEVIGIRLGQGIWLEEQVSDFGFPTGFMSSYDHDDKDGVRQVGWRAHALTCFAVLHALFRMVVWPL